MTIFAFPIVSSHFAFYALVVEFLLLTMFYGSGVVAFWQLFYAKAC